VTPNSSYKNLSYTIVPILIALLLNGLDLFQSWLGINHAQELSLTILLITAVLWISEAIPLFVTSFLILFLQIAWLMPAINADSGIEGKTQSEIFLSPFFSDIILLFLGGFVLSAALHKYGLDQRIAAWILKRTGNKPSRILIGIIAVSATLSMWMSNTATAAMMLVIVYPIIAKIPEKNRFSKALTLSIPFACNLGGLGTPIGSPPNAIAMKYLAEQGISLSFAEWMLAVLPFLFLFLAFLWFLLLKLFPPENLSLEFDFEEKDPLSRKQYVVVAIFLITCLGWLTTQYHGFSTGTVSLIPIVAFFGFHFLDTEDFRSLSWDILFMLGGGLCLGVGLKASGLTLSLVEMIPEEEGIAFVLFAVLAALMTTFMSNTATANLLIPIAVSLSGNTAALVATIAIICSTAMALPVSTPPNAIAFGSGILKSKDMILPGLAITAFGIVVVLLLAPGYWRLLGVFG